MIFDTREPLVYCADCQFSISCEFVTTCNRGLEQRPDRYRCGWFKSKDDLDNIELFVPKENPSWWEK